MIRDVHSVGLRFVETIVNRGVTRSVIGGGGEGRGYIHIFVF